MVVRVAPVVGRTGMAERTVVPWLGRLDPDARNSGPLRLAERWRDRVPRCVRRPSLEDGAGAQN
jgi:hypothetical protein